MNGPRKPRVLLSEAEIRTGERTGRAWRSAWRGKARPVGFEAEELEPGDGSPAPPRRRPEREALAAATTAPPAPPARPRASEPPYGRDPR